MMYYFPIPFPLPWEDLYPAISTPLNPKYHTVTYPHPIPDISINSVIKYPAVVVQSRREPGPGG